MTSIELASVADALAALDHATAQLVAAEVGQVLAIAACCDLHRVDETILIEGAERWVRGGSDGTPYIGEFVAGEIGVLLGVSPQSAMVRIGQVLNVRHRHPTLWQAVCTGEVRFWEAARIADACVIAKLDAIGALWVDRQCATALALQPWSRVRGQVDRWIVLADPALAGERAAAAAERRTVIVSGIKDGQCELWGRLDAGDGIAFDEAISAVAAGLSADSPLDHRRAAAVGVLARQALGQPELPRKAEIIVHIDATPQPSGHEADPSGGGEPGRGEGSLAGDLGEAAALAGPLALAPVADIDRWGPVLTTSLGDLLAGCTVTVRPILDPTRMAPVDGYQLPESMRRVLEQRWPVDSFPYGTRASAGCDADHSNGYDHQAPRGAGQTHPDVMSPLARFSHRLPTHGGWSRTQPVPGMLVWESPHGYRFTVTPTGTVLIGRPSPPQYRWWLQEPPDWLDPPDRREGGAPPDTSGAPGTDCGVPPDPGPAQPPLALDPTH